MNCESGGYMIYALLTAVSSITPTATLVPTATPTLAPTATPIPTPTPTPLPVFVSMADGNGWEIAGIIIAFLGVIATFILGIAALKASKAANRASETANTIAQQQQEYEEEMRKREAKIAVMDKAFEVYNFFMKEIDNDKYFDFSQEDLVKKNLEKLEEINYLSRLLFRKEAYVPIQSELCRYRSILTFFKYPDYDEIKWHYEMYPELNIDYLSLVKTRNEPSEDKKKRYLLVYLSQKIIENIFSEYRLNL